MRPSYQTADEKKQKERTLNKQYRIDNIDELKIKQKEYRANLPPLTDEEREASRIYQREYMRQRRAALPKKERKKRTEDQIATSRANKTQRDKAARQNQSAEDKERRRIRHNELQQKRRLELS